MSSDKDELDEDALDAMMMDLEKSGDVFNKPDVQMPKDEPEAQPSLKFPVADALSAIPDRGEIPFGEFTEEGDDPLWQEPECMMDFLEEFKNLPVPPFEFRFPGEQGNETLCTDPYWQTLQSAMLFLGIPYEVVNSKNFDPDDTPSLIMGNELWQEPEKCVEKLCERYVLSDLVMSARPINDLLDSLQDSFMECVLNNNKKKNQVLYNNLMGQFFALNKRISRSRGDFIESDEVTMGDIILGPRLHHMEIALKHCKNYPIPEELTALKKYKENLLDTDFIKRVLLPDDVVKARYEQLRSAEPAKV
eukprot:CAMPEP_0113935238 /NCGR_PEP_ID=MMETSP1339-20121228/2419_1 /TAXON_ID=94617 /ORGANISM="Fibrocapsa japonica" /LENGTH=304 /DNA_ID=CAMNT_0000937309 /DNA_START=198 /DNA_END=1112 /DNA_ORIENTATION=+ /assembly_acc=CAM_ASM_000762